MGKKFVPLSFALVDEGELARDVDEALADTSRELFAHRRRYGVEATAKAKAEVTIKVTIQAGVEDADYSIKGSISKKVPGRPARTSIALQDRDDQHQETLFVRATGSDESSPRQGKLVTDRGEVIDQVTGEVRDTTAKRGAK